MTRRRYWVYFLLFLFNFICYLDRINMSVAGKPVAQEFGSFASRPRLSVLVVPVGLRRDDAAQRPSGGSPRRTPHGRDRRHCLVRSRKCSAAPPRASSPCC